MLKLIPLGLVCLLLSSCANQTNNGAVTISELNSKDNGIFQVQGTCSEGTQGIVSISDSTSSISAYSNRKCDGYGKARIVKEGDSARMVYFRPMKHVTGGPYKVVSKRNTIEGPLYELDNGYTVSLIQNKGWGPVYSTPSGYVR